MRTFSKTLAIVGTLMLLQPVSGAEWAKLHPAFGGVGKPGSWLPVSAEVTGLTPGAEYQLLAKFSDPRGDRVSQIVATGKTNETGNLSVSGNFAVGRLLGEGTFSIVESGGNETVVQASVRHSEDAELDDANVMSSMRLLRHGIPLLLTTSEVAGIPELVRNATAMRGESTL